MTFSNLILPGAALALAVFGAATTMAHENDTPSDNGYPLTCGITVESGAFGPTYKGVVTATEHVNGTYQMQFMKSGSNSASINQSGAFDLRPGESATVGQASLGGSGKVDAKLTVTFDGTRMVCQTPGALDL